MYEVIFDEEAIEFLNKLVPSTISNALNGAYFLNLRKYSQKAN